MSENFIDGDASINRTPLLPMQNNSPSPDTNTKKLISEVRMLNSKVCELRSLNDDIENDNRELMRINSELESKISSLEEKCRNKDREIEEMRYSWFEFEKLREEYKRNVDELNRVKVTLRDAQEIAENVKFLENENDQLQNDNEKFQNRIKVLESKIDELKTDEGYKPMYEQARDALYSAEQALAELLRENERARELSESEALESSGQPHTTPGWSKISCSKCTCTCHHGSATPARQLGDMALRRFSTVSNFDLPSGGNTTPVRSNDRQSMDINTSVIDISLWRDCRTGANLHDVSGECLGEIMAQDAKIQDLQAQLNETRCEIDRLNDELASQMVIKEDLTEAKKKLESKMADLIAENCIRESENELRLLNLKEENSKVERQLDEMVSESKRLKELITSLSSENSNLVTQHKLVFEEAELKLKVLKSERDNAQAQLDEKSAALSETTSQIEKLTTMNQSLIESLKSTENKLLEVNCRLQDVDLQLQEATAEKTALSEKVADLVENKRVLIAKITETTNTLCETRADLLLLQDSSGEAIASLESEVASLRAELSVCQDKLESSEAHKVELFERIDLLQTRNLEIDNNKNKLMQELATSESTIKDLKEQIQMLNVSMDEKVALIHHLKSERTDMISEKSAASERQDILKAELLQAKEEISRLSAELADAVSRVMNVEEMESALRSRESDASAMNQLIEEQKTTISLLEEENSALESSVESLKADLASKESLLVAARKEYNELNENVVKMVEKFENERENLKSCFEERVNQKLELEEKLSLSEQELSLRIKQVSEKEDEVATLQLEVSKHISDKTKLQDDLDEGKSRTASLQDELAALRINLFQVEEKASTHELKVAQLIAENSHIRKKLEDQLKDIINKESEINRLKDEVENLMKCNDEISGANSRLENERAQLELELANNRQQYSDSRLKNLKRQLSLMRGEHIDAEQSLAEAKKNASLAEMHRQVAESESARLNKVVEILQKRLDTVTEERMACEERAAAEAVRCRQLEGALNEKEAVIEGLQHSLKKKDMQLKSAQAKEASTLQQYLKSQAAQDEAERLIAVLKSRNDSKRQSYYSLDQFINPCVSAAGEFVRPGQLQRTHSDGRVEAQKSTNVGAAERTTTYYPPKSVSKFPVPVEELRFRSPMTSNFLRELRTARGARMSDVTVHDSTFLTCLEEPADDITVTNDENDSSVIPQLRFPPPPPSPVLHFIEDTDATLCTPLTSQRVQPLRGMLSQESSAKPRECIASSSFNIAQVSKVKIQEAKEDEKKQGHSPSSSDASISPTITAVSDLEDWPPYSSITVPLSPKSLCVGGIFTVPPPVEHQYRRIKRTLLSPAVEEEEKDGLSFGCLEDKSLMTACYGMNVAQSASSQARPMDMISEKKNDRVEPVERSASPNLEAHDSEATDILPEGRLTETSEIASRIRLFKSRTIQMKSRPISIAEQSDDTSACSASMSSPSKLPRFQSFQDLPGAASGDLSAESKKNKAVNLNLKNRMAIRGRKNVRSDSKNEPTGGDNRSEASASSRKPLKSKKYAKIRLSDLFKSKKHKW